MIKQIFTWWNSQTFGTLIYTMFFGKLVGKDEFGNKYYRNTKDQRWVIYNGEINASKITTEWYSWIHKISKKIPVQEKKFSWQKSHKDNKTGTNESFKANEISKDKKNFKKYESWKP